MLKALSLTQAVAHSNQAHQGQQLALPRAPEHSGTLGCGLLASPPLQGQFLVAAQSERAGLDLLFALHCIKLVIQSQQK